MFLCVYCHQPQNCDRSKHSRDPQGHWRRTAGQILTREVVKVGKPFQFHLLISPPAPSAPTSGCFPVNTRLTICLPKESPIKVPTANESTFCSSILVRLALRATQGSINRHENNNFQYHSQALSSPLFQSTLIFLPVLGW